MTTVTGYLALILFFASPCWYSLPSFPGKDQGVKDGSREPSCKSSYYPKLYPHEYDCSKFWQCSSGDNPCLFECPSIKIDDNAGSNGTLLFNEKVLACDWPRNVDCSSVTRCSRVLRYEGELVNTGIYKKSTSLHNGRAWFKHWSEDSCLFFARHWKIDACSFVENNIDWSLGYVWTDQDEECPEDVGFNWRYYSWETDNNIGPVDPSITVTIA